MGRISKCLLLLVCVCATGSALAKDTAQWKVAGDVYKSNKQAKPVAGLAVGAINVDVGMHLERLTLLSGEGHAGKKAAGAGLALGLTLMGVGGGVDTASREPLEDHLQEVDARRIADEVAQIVQDRFAALPDVKVVAGEAVTAAPWYAGLGGLAEMKTGKVAFSEGRFSPDYYFGYYSTPAGGYRYRPTSKFAFSDKTFSPVIRQQTGADVTAVVDVFLVNTRKEFRVHQMRVSLYGQTWSGQKGGDTPTFTLNLEDAGAVAVPVSKGEHKNAYTHWSALRPLFEATMDEAVRRIRLAVPFAPVVSASAAVVSTAAGG